MKPQIQKIYDMTPMQKGMLFTKLKVNSDAYFEQMHFVIKNTLDIFCLKKAYQALIDKYEVFRTIFRYEKIDHLKQVVLSTRETDIYYDDLLSIPKEERANIIEQYCNDDRSAGFNLAKDILSRISVFRTEESQYRFVWSFHHIILDGWSLSNVIDELFQNYKILLDGGYVSTECKYPYSNYIDWLNTYNKDIALSYWERYLSDYDVVAVVPLKRHEKIDGYELAQRKFYLGEKLSERLVTSARQNGVAVNSVFQAAWGIVLQKYNQSPDVVFGAVVNGRPPEIEGYNEMVGLFINTIPVRVVAAETDTFMDTARSVQKNALESLAYQYSSLAEIQAISSVKQNLIQNIMVFENYPKASRDNKSRIIMSDFTLDEQTNYDLNIIIIPDSNFEIVFNYNKNVYSDRDIQVIAECLLFVLRSAINMEDWLVADFNINAPETLKIILENNETDTPLEQGTVIDKFLRTVQKVPNAVALITEGGSISYQELNDFSNKIAQFLIEKGIQSNDVVGVSAERSVEMLSAIIGILKAGAAYLPIDISYPKDRISFMIEDASPKILLYHGGCLFQDIRMEQKQISSIIHGGETPQDINLANPDNFAYVIYTSGSTGRPKGTPIGHRSLLNRIAWMNESYPVNGSSVFMQKTTYTFDVSVWELMWWFWNGSSLYLLPQGKEKNPESIVQSIAKYKVSVIHFVPTMLASFLEYIDSVKSRDLLKTLQYVFASGEALLPEHVCKLYANCSADLVNLYGPTEATIDVSFFNCKKTVQYRNVPIGKPISNIQLWVISSKMELLPPGVAGELAITGVGLSCGYLNNEELTKKFFVDCPWLEDKKMYLTGDVVRLLSDGNIEYIGRRDNQVKIRGFRIELSEIESAIASIPHVKGAITAYREDTHKNKYLCGYVQCDESHQLVYGGVNRHQLPNGLAPCFLNINETIFMYQEIFERKNYLRNGIELKDGDCVIDVGANIGLFSLFTESYATNLTVHSLEPIPQIYNILEKNIELYGKNISLHNIGLSDENKKREFVFYPKASIMSGAYTDVRQDHQTFESTLVHDSMTDKEKAIISENQQYFLEDRFKKEYVICELFTFDWFVETNGISQIDLLKIDVEKSEMDVLRGIKRNWEAIKQIVIEVHDFNNNVAEVNAILQKQGYHVLSVQDTNPNSKLYSVYASRKNELCSHKKSIDLKMDFYSPILSKERIKAELGKRLPEYMIPSQYVFLQRFPLLANGKVNRKALPDPLALLNKKLTDTPDTKNMNEREEILLGLWKEILDLNAVSTTDNFFNLGGDSIKAIQLSARLGKYKIRLDIDQIFQYPTIQELSSVLQEAYNNVLQDKVTGVAPLSPIQIEFWEAGEPNHYCQSIGIEMKKNLSDQNLLKIANALVTHHDALRTSIIGKDGAYYQSVNEKPESAYEILKFALNDQESIDTQINQKLYEVYKSFDVFKNPLVKIAHFVINNRSILFLCIHHLVVDGVSWRIILEDFASILTQISQEKITLPDKTQSYQDWVQKLYLYTKSGLMNDQYTYWEDIANSKYDSIPGLNEISKKEQIYKNMKSVSFTLNKMSTQQFIKHCINEYDATVEELLLVTLFSALQKWRGLNKIMIKMEGHGRSNIQKEINVSRTVGWFTSTYPFFFAYDSEAKYSETISHLKEKMREIPIKGIGYGMLKYLSQKADRLSCDPWLSFNYLGELISKENKNTDFTAVAFNKGNVIGENRPGCTGVAVDAIIADNQLVIRIYFNQLELSINTLSELAVYYENALLQLILNSQMAKKNTLPGQCKVEDIKPFCGVFYKDCYINALLPVFMKCSSENLFFANNIYLYRYDDTRKGIPIFLENIEIVKECDLLQEAGIKVKKELIIDDIVSELKKSISQQKPVLIRVDCFYEENREDFFHKKHWPHVVLVVSYDDENEIFTIIEHDNIDSYQYKEYEISYQSLAESYKGSIEQFHDGVSPSYFEYSYSNKTPSPSIEYVQQRYLTNLKVNSEAIAMGLQHLIDFGKWIDSERKDAFYENIDEIIFIMNDIINGKKVDMFNRNAIFADRLDIVEQNDKILNEFEMLRTQILKVKFSNKSNSLNLEKISKNIQNIFTMEAAIQQALLNSD